MATRFPSVFCLVNSHLSSDGTAIGAKSKVGISNSEEFDSMTCDLGFVLMAWEMMEATLVDAEEMFIQNESVKKWLKVVKKLAFDAEDVLDACEYDLIDAEVKGKGKVRTIFTPSLLTIPSFRDSVPRMAGIIRNEFYAIDKLKEEDNEALEGYVETAFSKASKSRQNISNPDRNTDLIGRDEDRKRLREMLLEESNIVGDIGIVALVGMGGLGKTALSQKVYSDFNVDQFYLKGWVCVSSNSDILRLTKDVYKSLTNNPLDFSTLDPVMVHLQSEVDNKKVLLVLDDVWKVDSDDFWENFCRPFKTCAKGSKILITRREESSTDLSMSNREKLYKLESLNRQDSWFLFQKFAFHDCGLSEKTVSAELQTEILDMCKGVPLALKILGSLLNNYQEDENDWWKVLHSGIAKAGDGSDNVIQILQLSYFHLPWYLKSCFRFCSVFEKGELISAKDLVVWWMQSDLIKYRDNNVNEWDDIGMEYIDELLSRSLFQCHINPHNGEIEEGSISMHDFILDVAEYISGEESVKVLDNHEIYDSNHEVRHLMVQTNITSKNRSILSNNFDNIRSLFMTNLLTNYGIDRHIKNMVHLRVLLLYNTDTHILFKYIQNLKCLRHLVLRDFKDIKVSISVCKLYNLQTLDLQFGTIKQLPSAIVNMKKLCHLHLKLESLSKSIGKLTNLQTLDLKDSTINQLPNSIGKLKHLRILDVRKANIDRLPCQILLLTNLRELYFPYSIEGLPKGIGRLTKLKRLSQFPVSIDFYQHASLSELEYMTRLRDHLNIRGSELSPDTNLINKVHFDELPFLPSVQSLQISYCHFLHTIPLNKFPVLQSLYVNNCPNISSIDFDGSINSFLTKLSFVRCPELIAFPEPYPSIVHLAVISCKFLESIQLTKFPSLQSLRLSNCDNLSAIEFEENIHSYLKKLHVLYCPKLNGLPKLPLSMVRIEVASCNSFQLIQFDQLSALQKIDISESENLSSIEFKANINSLTELCICNCPKLTALSELPSSIVFLWVICCRTLQSLSLQKLSVLQEIDIADCESLSSIESENLIFSFLTYLSIKRCPKFNGLPKLEIQNILTLHLSQLDSLESLHIHKYPSLQKLYIEHCHNLLSVDFREREQFNLNFPISSTLRRIVITDCPNVTFYPQAIEFSPALERFNIDKKCCKLIGWCKANKDFRLQSILKISDKIHPRDVIT